MEQPKKKKQQLCLMCGNILDKEPPFCRRCDSDAGWTYKPEGAAPGAKTAQTPAPAAKAAQPAPAPVKPKRILVVDDEANIILFLKTRLEASGYEVITAGDGEEAFRKLRAEKPDLVILDILMPKMTGYEFIQKFNAEYSGSNRTPVIAVSARGDMGNFLKPSDVFRFFEKPFDSRELIAGIHEALNQPG